jgi:hypothetical protein
MPRRINKWRIPTKPPAALMCGSNLTHDRIADSSSDFSGLHSIGVPVQYRQIEAISQKWVVLGGKVFLDGLQVSREGL